MPTQPEANRLNLEFYRKQAKELLASAKAGDRSALDRLGKPEPKLSDAQLAVARDQGFVSWPKFRAFVIESGLLDAGLADAFIDAAVSDLGRAKALLDAHPSLIDAGFYAALVLGDSKRIEQHLAATAMLAKGASGPQKWEPISYICFSHFANPRSGRAGGFADAARVLLKHGADPNASVLLPSWPANPLPVLYAATGLNNNPALARVLLEAGADPNDSESVYHSTEHPDLECLKLLLANGASLEGKNALKHMLDREDPEGLRVLFAAGADPNEVNPEGATALHWAVMRERSGVIVGMLLDYGAPIDARRSDGRTAYAMAVQSGQKAMAELLKSRGADEGIAEVDRFLGAFDTEDPKELARRLAAQPELAGAPALERSVPDFTANHRSAAVRAALAIGMPVNARGEHGATALHWACWKGYADLVELLLAHGASLTIEDEQYHGTPAGWLGHGARNCGDGGGDYPQVARLLIAAGAEIPEADLPVLRELGVI